MEMTRLFALLAILLASQAWAESGSRPVFRPRTNAKNCGPLDARKARPQLKEFYAIPKSQDAMGWCYASATADMYSHKLGFPVSAVDLAVSYNHDIQSNARKRAVRTLMETLGINKRMNGAYQAGFISLAVKDAQKYGLCPAARMPSKSANEPGSKTELRTLIGTIGGLAELVQKRGLGREQFKLDMECFEQAGGTNYYKTYFPGLDMAELYDFLVAEAGQNVNSLVFKLAQQHCAGQRILPPKNLKLKKPNPESWFSAIDSQLKRGNILGIEFYTRMLRGKQVGPLAGHAVSVIGRDFIDGECRYLLRNSWVTGCMMYSEELKEYCDASNGTVWVSEKQMKPYLKSVAYLE